MKKILKFTRINIIFDILFSLMMVLLIIFLPSFGMSGAFTQLSIVHKLLSFSVSFTASLIIYYPLVASIVYLINAIKDSTYILKEIILAIIFIVIFNPWTFSVVLAKSSLAPKSNQSTVVPQNNVQNSNQPNCGLKINDFNPNSKIEEAGINKGENILSINGAQIDSLQDIFDQLQGKKPGDRVSLETNTGIKSVELVASPNDPNRSALGVKLVTNICE